MISIFIFLILTCQILNAEYDLIDGQEKTISTLSTSSSYFFYIEAEEDQELDIEISMDYSSENVMAFMNIDELSSRKGSSIHNTYCYLQYLSTKNNKSIFTKKYSIWSPSTKYVSFEIRPKTHISNFNILIKVSTNSNTSALLCAILIPIFVCLFLSFIFISLCIKIRRRKRLQLEQQAKFNNPTQQLYNMNPGNYPPQQQNPPQMQYQSPPPTSDYPLQPGYPPQQKDSAYQQYIASGQIYQ